MNKYGRWSKFKQELMPIIFVSAIQIWWSFNLPATRLEDSFGVFLALIRSIVGVLSTIYIFSFADTFSPYFNLDYLNEAPYSSIFKEVETAILVAIAHLIMFYVWYKDFYHVSNALYVLAYIGCLITFLLFYRAIHRVPLQ